MKKLLFLTFGVVSILLASHTESFAQATSTRIVAIEVDGKVIVPDYRVWFLSKDTWVEGRRTDSGFETPAEVLEQKWKTLAIVFEKYCLRFTDLHTSKFGTEWTVGVDNKPFSEKFVDRKDAKATAIAYYISFQGDGLLGTQVVVRELKRK